MAKERGSLLTYFQGLMEVVDVNDAQSKGRPFLEFGRIQKGLSTASSTLWQNQTVFLFMHNDIVSHKYIG